MAERVLLLNDIDVVRRFVGEAMLQKIRSGQMVSWATLGTLCDLLDLQPADLIEYVKEPTVQEKG